LRQFDVYRNPSPESRKIAPFLVMLSSHYLHDLSEIIVAPLVNDASRTVGDLELLVEINDQGLTLVVSELFSVTTTGLRSPGGNLGDREDDIRRAIERLFGGF
jgi:toxin CcdB